MIVTNIARYMFISFCSIKVLPHQQNPTQSKNNRSTNLEVHIFYEEIKSARQQIATNVHARWTSI